MTAPTGRRPVFDLIAEAANRFTPSERRVAEAVMQDPKIVAFGTVAQLAERSGSSGPTVLRFAAKLGFDGFVELQASVQEEIADQLRPATQRIRERPPSDVLGRTLAADLDNVRTTLGEVEPADFRDRGRAARRSPPARVRDRQRGVGRRGPACSPASSISPRRRVRDHRHAGEGVARPRRASSRPTWSSSSTFAATSGGCSRRRRARPTPGRRSIALTDGRLSPLAERAELTFVVAARGVGPFDSAVGAISLVHALDRRGRRPPPPQRDRTSRRGRSELARRHRPRRAVAASAYAPAHGRHSQAPQPRSHRRDGVGLRLAPCCARSG